MVSTVLIQSFGNWIKKTNYHYYYYRIQFISWDHQQNITTTTATTIATTPLHYQRQRMTTTRTTPTSNKVVNDENQKQQQQQPPLIVLAGWLGCHPKSLRRFEELYIDICSTRNNNSSIRNVRPTILTPIASPAMIVNTIMGHPSKNITTTSIGNEEAILAGASSSSLYPLLPPPDGWLTSSTSEQRVITNYKGSLEAYAWDVLRDIHNSMMENNCSYIVIHPFSNGGYFLWEMIRRILITYGKQHRQLFSIDQGSNPIHRSNEQDEIAIALGDIKNKIRGIVFDSCPAMDIDKLSQAMQYISWEEQLDVVRYCGWEYILFPYIPQWKQRVVDNAATYFAPLYSTCTTTTSTSSSSWQIPQLFFYSTDDPLTNAIHINKLIEQRQQQETQRQLTYYKRWEKSSHCGHLKNHPIEYRNEIESFLKVIISPQKEESQDELSVGIELQNDQTTKKVPPTVQSKL